MNKRRIAILFFLLLVLVPTAFSQSGDNPFDLKPRIKKTEKESEAVLDEQQKKSDNPFDIQKTEKKVLTPPPERKEKEVIAPTQLSAEEENYSRFLFFMTIIGIGLFTAVFTFFKKTLQKVYDAILNDNLLKQAFRARETGKMLPYFMLYGMFFLNFGFFVFLLSKHFGIIPPGQATQYLLQIISGIFLLYMVKHLVLRLIGAIFLVRKETSLYDFTIILFAIIAGVLFLPLNILIAYIGTGAAPFILWAALIIFAALVLFRSFRGIFIGVDLLGKHPFHFLLYICTVEIAPALILIKLFQNQYGV